MQYGLLFILGDLAHTVPHTGAKGINLAIPDMRMPACALEAICKSGSTERLEHYVGVCLRRLWKVQRFSWWVTPLMRRFDEHKPFDLGRQIDEIGYLTSSRSTMTTWSENCMGLPMEWG
jgi:p-hydroxybenzoate 3-monooxygenase